MNNYGSAFEPIRRSHDHIPVLNTGGRKTLSVGIGRDYSRELPKGDAIRSYEASTHLIDSEGRPTRQIRGEHDAPSRRHVLLAAIAAVTLATGYVGVKAIDHDHGPDVTPLVNQIHTDNNNHEPLQSPTPATPAVQRDAAALNNTP